MFKRNLFFTTVFSILPGILFAATYYVDPSGNDGCRGNSKETPFKTIFPALEKVQPGDSVFFKGGRHCYATPIVISTNGTPDARICFMAYPGEIAVFDFSECRDDGPGVLVTGSYQDFVDKVYENKTGSSGKGLQLESSNNRFIRCVFRRNGNSGLQIDGGAANNQIINCDAYYNGVDNVDDGDGFCPKLDVGSGNKFTGCRSWQNGDDGWDGYLKSDREITTYLENCWAFKNGYKENGTASGGNGNGFKYGSEKGNHNQTLKNCLAFENFSKGFDQNHDRGTIVLLNCTAFNNVRYNYMSADAPNPGHSFTIKNCISMKTTNLMGDDFGTTTLQITNSWMNGLKVDATDFESIDFSGATGARKSDGSLPDLKFMHLKQGSDLIDAGVDVGLPYQGRAPDLGCYESPYATATTHAGKGASGGVWRLVCNDNQAAITFTKTFAGYADISVCTIAGRQIVALSHRALDGERTIPVLDRSRTTAGIYICSVKYNGVVSTQKMMMK